MNVDGFCGRPPRGGERDSQLSVRCVWCCLRGGQCPSRGEPDTHRLGQVAGVRVSGRVDHACSGQDVRRTAFYL